MNMGTDAADQVMKMTLQGIEVLARLSGAGAKNLATYLYSILANQQKTKGKTRLVRLLRSGSELKVFAVRHEDLPTFTKEAKRYGVLYCALRDKKSLDGMCDIMVRAEDAAKINRIVDRFHISTVNTANITPKDMRSVQKEQAARDDSAVPTRKSTDDFWADLLSNTVPTRPDLSRENQNTDHANPTKAGMKYARPFENTLESSAPNESKSVRKQLAEIKAEQQRQTSQRPDPHHVHSRHPKTSAPKKTKKPKGR